jgi:uncharacterized protein YdgA (DUF945 family)
MKKAAVIGVAVVVVLVGGSPALTGGMARKQYEAQIDKIAAALPAIKVVERKYEQGLFSSTATTTFQVGCDAAAITVRDRIAHGPFPDFSGFGLARIDTRIALPPDAPAPLRAWMEGLGPEALRTTVGFGGASETRLNLPAGQFKDAQGGESGSLQWKPVSATFRVDGAMTRMSYELDMPEVTLDFTARDETGSFKLVNLRGQFDGEPMAGNWLTGVGAGAFTIDRMQMDVTGGQSQGVQFNLNQMKYTVKSQAEKDLLSATASVTATADFKMGKTALKLDKIELQESVKRLHAPTLHALTLGFWQEMGNLCKAQPAGDDAIQTLRDKRAAMLAALAQLLPYDPEYSMDKIAVSVGGQEGTLAYSLAAHGMTAQDLQGGDPRQLVGKITAKASGKVPVAWLEGIGAAMMSERSGGASPQQVQELVHNQLGGIIDELAGQGYVTREGDALSSSAQFEQGKLTVNGKPLSVPLPLPGQ